MPLLFVTAAIQPFAGGVDGIPLQKIVLAVCTALAILALFLQAFSRPLDFPAAKSRFQINFNRLSYDNSPLLTVARGFLTISVCLLSLDVSLRKTRFHQFWDLGASGWDGFVRSAGFVTSGAGCWGFESVAF